PPKGEIGFMPLASGTMAVSASVVAYLRACREVVELRRETITRPVAVAGPRIALTDAFDQERFPSRIVVPEIGRTILFNESRMLLLDEKGGEIVEREATDIALSPTRRFLAFSADEQFQVLDLMDGAVLAQLPGSDLSWGHADSIIMSVTMPWARVWAASTFKEGMLVADGKTNCSSCWPWDGTLIDINLENGFMLVAGPLGYTMARLDDPTDRLYDPNTIIADTDLRGARAPIERFLNDMAAVGPASLAMRWIVAEGMLRTNGSAMEGETVGEALPRPYVERNVTRPEAMAVASLSPMSIVRPKGRSGSGVPSGRRGLLDALAEFGFAAKASISAKLEIEPHGITFDEPGYEETQARMEARQAEIRGRLTGDLKAVGIPVQWSGKTGDAFLDLSCPQFESRSGDLAELIDYAYRFDLHGRVVWVVRTACIGGHTLGTIRTYSEFAVFDSRRPLPVPDAIVETYDTMGNLHDPLFYEDAFEAKIAGDRWLVIFTPAGGRITVFDLETRKIVFRQEGLARGDLLADVHVSSDGRHVLQENADGSFLLYRLADGTLALSGRSVEGEVVFWTPSYHFDSSAEGAELVNLRFPGRAGQHAFQQFDERLRTPGLFQEVLAGSFAAAPFPIPAPPELGGSLALVDARIVGTVDVSGTAPVEDVLVFQDGVLTDRIDAVATGTVAIDVSRRLGARWATVVARDANRLTSTPLGIDLGADPAGLPGVRLLGVAVDRYADPTLSPFNYAKKDLLDVFTTLGRLSGTSIDLLSGPELILTDDRATPNAVLASVESLVRDLDASEMAIVFFSGH
ncbi:MAG: hypothetical protein J0H08_12975, partial [Rhizobiales bacterium]|nr:hypothetical protein [Hyphomicrobiales bacterium]